MAANTNELLLQECRDLFRDHLVEAVRRTFDGMDETLMELADRSSNYEIRRRYLDARDMARRHREVIESQFRRCLMSEVQSRIDVSRQGRQATGSFSLEDLQLVGEDDLNETLSFNDMATKVRSHCEDEISALDQRAAVLLGKPAIDADDNPFGAKVVSDAFKHACQQVDCPLEVRLVFMRSFETLAMDGIRGTLREVNDLLVANSVLPRIRYGITKHEGKQRTAPGSPINAPAQRAANEEVPAAAAPNDMFSMLTSLLAGPSAGPAAAGGASGGAGNGGPGGGGGGLGVGGAPLIEGAQLMGSLTSLQRGDASVLGASAAEIGPILAEAGNLQNVLRKLKGTSVGAGLGQMDAMTLEIVSMLFDALFEDPKVPVAIKGLIGRLQLPMLKVAITDKELFSSKTHPARRLLDAFGQLGLRVPRDLAADNPLFAKLEGYVDALVHEFQDNVEIFDAVREQLEGIIAGEDERVALQMQATQRNLEQAEALALAKSEVQAELAARIAARPETPRAVVEFLAQEWIKPLVIVRARDGQASEAWRAASETTDQLLWSVQSKATPEARRALTSAIPALLRKIKAAVAEAGIADERALAFLGELMACHKSALRLAPAHEPARAPATTPHAGATAAKTPGVPDDLLDFTQPVTLNNPFGEGKVQVDDNDLDFTAQPADAASASAATAQPTLEIIEPAIVNPALVVHARSVPPARKIRLPAGLIVGAWVTVADRHHRVERPARLHYVSPLKSHFLFVDRQGNKVYECSRTMLAGRLALGEVVLLDGEPDGSLFDRIMEGIFGKLKRPAMVPQAA